MEQYLNLLNKILKEGIDRSDRTGVGTRSIFGCQMRFKISDGFPAVTTKKLAFNVVKAELLWFLKGSDDVNVLKRMGAHIWDANAQAPYWVKKARFPGDVGRIYGVQWRKWQTFYSDIPFDQIKYVIEQIKKDPYSRRHLITAWNPEDLDKMALPPCHVLSQFYVANGKLSLLMYQRSCDMFLGVPFNIASYSLLLCMVAQVTNLEPYEFIHILGDAHIYHNHFQQVKEQLKRKPYPLPTLWLNPEVKDIDKFTLDDIKLLNYLYHPPLKAPMAV